MTRFVAVSMKPPERRCMHCGRPAVMSALRVTAADHRIGVRYCQEHYEMLCAPHRTRSPVRE